MNGQSEKPTIDEMTDFRTLCLKNARYQTRKTETENRPHDISNPHGTTHASESVTDSRHGKNDSDAYPHQRNKKGNNHGNERH